MSSSFFLSLLIELVHLAYSLDVHVFIMAFRAKTAGII